MSNADRYRSKFSVMIWHAKWMGATVPHQPISVLYFDFICRCLLCIWKINWGLFHILTGIDGIGHWLRKSWQGIHIFVFWASGCKDIAAKLLQYFLIRYSNLTTKRSKPSDRINSQRYGNKMYFDFCLTLIRLEKKLSRCRNLETGVHGSKKVL